MRSKKVSINAITSIMYELIKIISAFLLPRLILQSFGSDTNGINQAVTQFISYISLLTAGIGGVTTAALYKPIEEKDNDKISGIVNATEKFLRNVSKIFIVLLLLFSLLFPFFIEEFDYIFTFSLVLILGIGTFANYYFGLTYRMILNADQKQYIDTLIQIILTIIQTITSIVLINNNANIHTVQFVSTIIFMVNPIIIYVFVKKKYDINISIKPDYKAIDQRWDTLAHYIADFVNGNMDLVLLTIFLNLKEVSVYTIYMLVLNGIRMTINSLSTGIQSAFGNMFARGELESVKRNVKSFEFFVHSIAIILYTSMGLLIVSFIDLYTIDISDANYHRPLFGYLLSSVGLFIALRIPYQAVTRAAGHFRETRNGAILEAILNIVLSISLVIPFGMNGLIIGTLAATIFRTIQYGVYSSKNLLNRSLMVIAKRYLISIFNIGIIVLVVHLIPLKTPANYFHWIINGIIVSGVATLITILISLLFFYEDFKNTINFLSRVFKRTKKTVVT